MKSYDASGRVRLTDMHSNLAQLGSLNMLGAGSSAGRRRAFKLFSGDIFDGVLEPPTEEGERHWAHHILQWTFEPGSNAKPTIDRVLHIIRRVPTWRIAMTELLEWAVDVVPDDPAEEKARGELQRLYSNQESLPEKDALTILRTVLK